jgi:F420-non-reducing hydrogenase iron-sulfur subunit
MTDRRIALFCCESSGYPAFEAMTEPELKDAVELVRLPCSGKVEVGHMLEALERGYAGVLVLGCPLDNCTHLRGSHRAAKRVEAAARILSAVGMRPELVRIDFVSSVDGYKAAQAIRRMLDVTKAADAAKAQGRSGT